MKRECASQLDYQWIGLATGIVHSILAKYSFKNPKFYWILFHTSSSWVGVVRVHASNADKFLTMVENGLSLGRTLTIFIPRAEFLICIHDLKYV